MRRFGSRQLGQLIALNSAGLALLCLTLLPFTGCLQTRADQRLPWKQESLAKRIIVTQKCGSCHTLQARGLQLKGKIGPDLTHQATRQRSEEWLLRQLADPLSIPDEEVAAGFEGKQRLMPPLSRLHSEEMDALIAFLNSLN